MFVVSFMSLIDSNLHASPRVAPASLDCYAFSLCSTVCARACDKFVKPGVSQCHFCQKLLAWLVCHAWSSKIALFLVSVQSARRHFRTSSSFVSANYSDCFGNMSDRNLLRISATHVNIVCMELVEL